MSKETENIVAEEVKKEETSSQESNQDNSDTAEDPNKVVLLGTISYNNEKEYEEWLSKMDVNQAVFVLIASANFAQAKGAYSLSESELISSAIRSIKKSSTPPQEKEK